MTQEGFFQQNGFTLQEEPFLENGMEEGTKGKPLNEGQKEAVRECKENLLAVVQGPPGTCKHRNQPQLQKIANISLTLSLCFPHVAREAEGVHTIHISVFSFCTPHILFYNSTITPITAGTGKSYLTMCVVKSLANQESMPPILFITVKNTVLDATLLKLLEVSELAHLQHCSYIQPDQ